MAISGVSGALAGAAFTSGAIGFAMAVGTASTGTAISGLTGVAATNAALAWLGGGAVAAGGGGMAVGAAVLTGGAIVVVAAVGFGVNWVAKELDERSNRLLIEGRMAAVERHLAAACAS